MASWVCKQDGVLFTPGAPCCPQCGTRDAYEQGGDRSLNLYDSVEVTGIASPGAAWGVVNEAVAEGLHAIRQDGGVPMAAEEARAQIMGGGKDPEVEQLKRLVEELKRNPAPISENEGDAEVAERLGDVDDVTYREPDRSLGLPDDANPVDDRAATGDGTEVLEESGMSAGREQGGESGDAVPAEDTPDAGNAKSTAKARQKDVPS